MENKETTCTPCEQNFEDNINELVDQVEDYTRIRVLGRTRDDAAGECFDKVARVLGISTSSSYALLHSKGFPTLRVGGRMVVPRDQFIAWVDQHTGGSSAA